MIPPVRTLCTLAVLLAACGGAEEAAAPAVPTVAVGTAVVTRGTFTPTVRALGRVVPRDGQIAQLAAPASTRVAAVRVSEGATVHRGDVLVELDLQTFDADRVGADAALAAADSAWRRAVRLREAGILPQRDVEQRAAALAQARAVAVGANRSAELAVLRSPLDGVVTRMSATLGATVDPGMVLVEVVDLAALDIELSVAPTVASLLRPGMAVTVTGGATAGDTLGEATVRSIAGIIDSTGGGVAVRVRISSPRRTLRVGEAVEATLRLAPLTEVVLVPIAALVPDGDAEVVFVVGADGVAHRQSVTLGVRDGDHAVVTEGLAAGDRVVTEGAYGMVEGAITTTDTVGAP